MKASCSAIRSGHDRAGRARPRPAWIHRRAAGAAHREGIAMTNAHLLEMDAILSAPGFFDFLGELDGDRALGRRDAEPFDARWMASFDAIDGDPGAAIERPAVDALREKAFRLAFVASGNADVAACVSDDIDLVARSRLSGRVDDWPTQFLWDAYRSGRFPC
ncbi:hypothetical protein [Burkholderia metallica]|uniref:hypothetical protein n=2 Tax=Burkholderia metallica TaxID=488729 RepID=UPI001F5BA8EE|nr:hypothetical protein [Burkholderia metallica]